MRPLPFDPHVVAIAFLVLAGIGAVVLLVLALRGAAGALQSQEFAQQVNKLLRADNAERALKLCDAAGARPVAVLARIGLSASLQGDIPLEGRVEHGRMAMSQRLPAMQARAFRDVVVALVLAGVVTSTGIVAALLVHDDGQGMVPILGGVAVVDVLALVVVLGRLRLRADLARVVAGFGRA
ncbi:MAG: hypothetical protein ABSE49_05260 [Polyangiaceae bacterium]